MTEKDTSNSKLKGLEIYEELINEYIKNNDFEELRPVPICPNNVIHCNRIKKNEEQED